MRVGLKYFTLCLQNKLKLRVDLFESYMAEELKKNPNLSQIKTAKEWMEEFKKWSDSQAQLESLMLSYLKNND